MSAPDVDVLVVVPAGGTARRMGGGDKTALDVGGRSVLDRLLADLAPWPTVVVADPPAPDVRARAPHARWCREDPPGAGPLAALAAGLAAVPTARVLVAVAGDQPFAGRAVPALLAALGAEPAADAAAAVDADGRRQPLLAAYRTAAVAPVLRGAVADRPVRALWTGLRVVPVPLPEPQLLDLDDAADLARARRTVADGHAPA